MVGIDISEPMIDLACEREARQPLGREYRVGDARNIMRQKDFDLVVAAWVLVHARSRAELTQMCGGLASRLRPTGSFASVTTYGKHGLQMTLPERLCERVPFRFTIVIDNPPTTFEDGYLPIGALGYTFAQTGFRDFAVHMPELSPAIEDQLGFGDKFLRYPVSNLADCVKHPDPRTGKNSSPTGPERAADPSVTRHSLGHSAIRRSRGPRCGADGRPPRQRLR